ncbi:hypothetical protein Forpe1208_v012290 [Fusarium oxysporum f. sp. rapae]|uniref:Restriction endonuclease domain-containing protein n=1 Tax=Fusarium oxysporum f. sp. rapae TaxID=485398 RepID=A0A8J5NP77_FUSOX|nr:hypothetical protein Forpe1208_v012290 [Fusarium oxysporum f. sp. rapae]
MSRPTPDHDPTPNMADKVDSQHANIVKHNQTQLSTSLSTTPPEKYSPLLPSPPTTAERPVQGVVDDSDYRLPDALLQHKLLSSTTDVPEFAQFKLDQKQYRKHHTKIERTFKRFDYEPRRSCLTIRMPSPTHDFFAIYFRDEVCTQLNKLVTSRTDETKDVARKIESAMGSRVLLKEVDDENDEIKREPDILFKYPGTVYPGVVVEVSYSQDGKDLRRLAQDYILYSNADVKLFIGIDLNYHRGLSTVSLWRPKIIESADGEELTTSQHVHAKPFLSSDGEAMNPDESLTIYLHDFATDEVSSVWPSAEINIQFSQLAQLFKDAQQRQREQESTCANVGVKSKRITKKRRLSSSPVQQLRPEDEDRIAGQEDAVAQKYHQADDDYVFEDETDEDYKPRAAKRRG